MIVYIDGLFVDEAEARASVFDSGFQHGDGLFETMRSYSGTIFALEEHLNRLIDSAKFLEIKNVPKKEVLSDACKNILEVNNLADARIRLTITRGPLDKTYPTVVITAAPFTGYDKSLYEKGMSAITLAGYRFSHNPLNRIKSTSYQLSALARRKAATTGCDEAILMNEQGYVTEGSYTNVFAIREEKIYTPPVVDGLLPGIMRGFVIKTATQAGHSVLQRSIYVDDIYRMDELFLTNSLMEIMPLVKIDKKSIGNSKPGPTTHNLMELVSKGIFRTLVAQPRSAGL